MVVSMKRKKSSGEEEDSGGVGGYEKIREERMRENFERMQKLGIIDLSQELRIKSITTENGRGGIARRRVSPSSTVDPKKDLLLPPLPPRRSSRLQNTTPVTYAEISIKEEGNSKKNGRVFVREGEREEIYTDEHSKLLGSCNTAWVLFVDGYDKDGRRIYDQIKGKTCHQCRQKTLGLHTHCSRCNLVQGQFCGDCLYMRYGENVLEVKKDPNWTCPVCRDICNCSICRAKKGWAPTGSLYRKVSSLGFKSVAHYLIQTRRCQSTSGDQVSCQLGSPQNALSVCDREGTAGPKLDSKNVLHSELVDINSNSDTQKSLAFNGTNGSFHPEELVNCVNLDACEKSSKLCSEKSNPSYEDEHANVSVTAVTPSGESFTTKTPDAVASLDSVASRLRKQTNKPSCVHENDSNFPGSVKPCEESKKTKKKTVAASLDCIASRLRKRADKT